MALLSLGVSVNAGVVNPIKSKSSKILVVGAGPGGVHMAAQLTKLGYKDITILERSHRVGGKSYAIYLDKDGKECEQVKDPKTGYVDTQSCVAHEMGTCYLHNGYTLVRNLVYEYGLTPEISPENRAIFSKYTASPLESQAMGDFLTSVIMEVVKSGKVKLPYWVPSSESLQVIWVLTDNVGRYK